MICGQRMSNPDIYSGELTLKTLLQLQYAKCTGTGLHGLTDPKCTPNINKEKAQIGDKSVPKIRNMVK